MNLYSPVNDQFNDSELFKMLIQKPRISWPTVTLLIAAFITFSVSTFAYLQGELPLGWAMLINSIASYMAFPAAHEATHSAVFKSRKINDWAGRAAMTLLEPGPFFQVFRFIHTLSILKLTYHQRPSRKDLRANVENFMFLFYLP